ncbi:MAG: hypothetical protein ACRD8W_25585 [Nitrososphaeraceae archaeon]
MKERKVLNKMCISILKTNKQIKFVSVVDGNCKLLVGGSRRSDNKQAHEYHYGLRRGYIFYLEYLFFAINNFKRRPEFAISNKNSIHNSHTGLYFEITGSKSDAMVAVTALNKSRDKFLCIYFEPVVQDQVHPVYALEEFNSLLVKICYNVL